MAQTIVLIAHIGAGIFAILSGFTALFAAKGERLHRASGNIYALFMCLTAASASLLGFIGGDMNDVITGVLVVYLVATAWMAAKRQDNESGQFEKVAFLAAVIGVGILVYISFNVPSRTSQQVGIGPSLIFAAVFALAALLDLRVILRGGLSGKHRIARHLWRMCLGMFIATGSFFLGQMQVFPEPLQRIEIMAAPVVLVILMMVFWLSRVLWTKWWKEEPDAENAIPNKF
jgi:uncharacterized membrane protein